MEDDADATTSVDVVRKAQRSRGEHGELVVAGTADAKRSSSEDE